jgi:iron complex outermembrane receptor protein
MIGERHDLVFGADTIFRSAHTASHTGTVFWSPSDPSFAVSGAFLQDEMLFAGGAVRLTGGLRLEHNTFSGVNLQPNARMLWKMTKAQSVWFAYSRANRSPSPADTAIVTNVAIFPGPGGFKELRLISDPDIAPEKLNAFELGYRIQAGKKLSLDATSFYNGYSDLVGQAPGQPFFEAGLPPRLVIPLITKNNESGGTFGAELAGHWAPTQLLRFDSAYSYSAFDISQKTAAGNSPVRLWGEPPRHKAYVSSSVGLWHGVTLDSALRFIDRRVAQNLPGFTQLDSALVWRPSDSGEFKIGCDNLFNKEHVEFLSQQGVNSTALGRSVYGRVTWHFMQPRNR